MGNASGRSPRPVRAMRPCACAWLRFRLRVGNNDVDTVSFKLCLDALCGLGLFQSDPVYRILCFTQCVLDCASVATVLRTQRHHRLRLIKGEVTTGQGIGLDLIEDRIRITGVAELITDRTCNGTENMNTLLMDWLTGEGIRKCQPSGFGLFRQAGQIILARWIVPSLLATLHEQIVGAHSPRLRRPRLRSARSASRRDPPSVFRLTPRLGQQ